MNTMSRNRRKATGSQRTSRSRVRAALVTLLGAAFALSAAGGAIASSLADFNRDGKLDLLTQRVGSDPPYPVIIRVHLGRGDGTFGPPLPVLDIQRYGLLKSLMRLNSF